MTEFLFLRHGSTQNLELQQWQGWSPVPLSSLGRRQAQAAAESLSGQGCIARVLSSPIARAQETAGIVASATNAEVEELDALKERMTATRLWGVGHADSLDYAAAAHKNRFDPGWRYEDEEPWPEVAARITRVVAAMQNLHAASPDARFVLVTHGITLRMTAAALLLGVDAALADWLRVADNLGPPECCSITRFEAGPHGMRLSAWNDTGHLNPV